MNFHKLYQAVNDELFTDITLTLIDSTNKITMDLHKIILYSSCIYFEKLLTNFKEKHLNEITIQVPNAFVCYDIIMSFYGQKTNIGNLPNWQHLLEFVRCYDFLGLESDTNLLKDLEIPSEGFELLLDVVELIGYDNYSNKLVIKNLPKDYDLSKLSKDLIKKILEFNQDNIVSGNNDGSIKIWNARTGELIKTLHGPPQGRSLASASRGPPLEGPSLASASRGHTKAVYSVCFSSDNKKIVSGSSDNSIKIWNSENFWESSSPEFTLNGHTRCVSSVCFFSDNKKIVSGSFDNSIKIWNAENGELIKTLNGHTNAVNSVCFSTDNERIVSGSYDHSIKIWNAENGKLIKTLSGHIASVWSVCFSPDNKRIVSGSSDNSIKIWDTITGELINTLNGHTNIVNSVCFSSDNKRIISGGSDKNIKIWNTESGKLINTLDCHTSSVRSVCFSSDNKRIVCGSINGIKIWNIKTLNNESQGISDPELIPQAGSAEPINALHCYTGSVWSVCCSSSYDRDLMEKLKKIIS